MSDIDTAAVDSLKALDPKRPIREATDIAAQANVRCWGNSDRASFNVRREKMTVIVTRRSKLVSAVENWRRSDKRCGARNDGRRHRTETVPDRFENFDCVFGQIVTQLRENWSRDTWP